MAFLVDLDLTPCWFFLQGFFSVDCILPGSMFGRLAVARVRRWVGMVVRFVYVRVSRGCVSRLTPVYRDTTGMCVPCVSVPAPPVSFYRDVCPGSPGVFEMRAPEVHWKQASYKLLLACLLACPLEVPRACLLACLGTAKPLAKPSAKLLAQPPKFGRQLGNLGNQ